MNAALVVHLQARHAPVVGAGPVVVRRTFASDIDEHTRQLQDWNLQYDQLDCGAFQGEFTDIRWPGMQLFVEKTARRLRQRGHLPPDACGIGSMLGGEGPMYVNGIQSGLGTLIACDSAELDMCTPAGCTLAGLVLDARVLHDAVRGMPELETLLKPGTLVSMTPPLDAIGRWSALLTASVQAAVASPGLLHDDVVRQRLHDDLLTGLIDAMTSVQGHGKVYRWDNRKRIVDRACDLIMSRPDAPPSLFEVCNRVGASPRKLGYCFQDVLGLSPARYIKAIRMNAVRRDLSRGGDPNSSVYDVAARWGFWHFGHFSVDYRKQFSEMPSETLRRARARFGH